MEKKLNLNPYCATTRHLTRLRLSSKHDCLVGVYHQNGWQIASDAFVLVAEKREYNKEFEGCVIDSKGNNVSDVYVDWQVPFRAMEKSREKAIELTLDVQKLIKTTELAIKVWDKECLALVRYGKCIFFAKQFLLFLKAMKHYKVNKVWTFLEPDTSWVVEGDSFKIAVYARSRIGSFTEEDIEGFADLSKIK